MCARGLTGRTPPTRSAGHAPAGARSGHALTSGPDHRLGADHVTYRIREYLASYDAPVGTEQDHVVMFTDLVGFTRITAVLGSQATGALLSHVMALQIERVVSFGGAIRNFMGDGLMASWAIAEMADRPAACAQTVQAALAITSALRRVPSPLQRRQGLAVRIGMHVGPALLGNVAAGYSRGRTLIGDTVNVAARLQQARRPRSAGVVIGPIRVSADLYGELTKIHQVWFPVRASIRACGRIVYLHSGSGGDPPTRARTRSRRTAGAIRARSYS